MIHLDLHWPTDAPSTSMAALRPVADRALALLVLALESAPESSSRQAVVGALKLFAAGLRDERMTTIDVSEATAVLTRCEEALRLAANERLVQQTEMRAVVTVLREVIAAIAAANQTLELHVHDSATRMVALTECNDIHELKNRLTGEVTRMKQLAVECRAHWQASVAGFERRVTELEGQLAHAQKEASLDALTHLANRRAFDRMAGQWLNGNGTPVMLAIVDLDNLKTLNDSGGHALGDTALKRVAAALRASVRAKDLVARLGGDEFGILATGLSAEQASARLETLQKSLAETALDPAGDFRATLTCGIAVSVAGDGIEGLLARADRALYRGKRAGKNCIVIDVEP